MSKKNKVKMMSISEPRKLQDAYNVDGCRYIREDLVENKMEDIMDRIAVAQEKQAAFYVKYDAMMEPIMEMASKAIKEQIKKMKRKPYPFS